MAPPAPQESHHDPPIAVGWFVYILCCNDGTYYTGVTTDLTRRLREHNFTRRGAKYTRTRRPVYLAYTEQVATRSAACIRERELRKLSAAAKRQLAHGP
jgi:putative endonuclease